MSGPTTGSVGIILDSSILVAFERRRFDFERFLGAQAPPAIAAITAGELFAWHFADLAARGEMIGDRDLQIAVTALSLDFDLASLNHHEFSRVTGLRMADVSPYVDPRDA